MGKNIVMKIKKILIVILVLFLIISNIYFVIRTPKLDYKILIGIPVNSEGDNSVGVDFTKSKPLKDKEDVTTIFLSLLRARTIDKTETTEHLPDAVITISDYSQACISYAQITLWLDESSIVLKIEDSRIPNYKKIENIYDVTELKKIIKRQMKFYKEY